MGEFRSGRRLVEEPFMVTFTKDQIKFLENKVTELEHELTKLEGEEPSCDGLELCRYDSGDGELWHSSQPRCSVTTWKIAVNNQDAEVKKFNVKVANAEKKLERLNKTFDL